MHKRNGMGRALAAILSAALVMTCMPASVWAEEAVVIEETYTQEEVAASPEETDGGVSSDESDVVSGSDSVDLIVEEAEVLTVSETEAPETAAPETAEETTAPETAEETAAPETAEETAAPETTEETAASEAAGEETAVSETSAAEASVQETEAGEEALVETAAEETAAATVSVETMAAEELITEETAEENTELSSEAGILSIELEETTESEEQAVVQSGYGTMTMTYQEFYTGLVSNASSVDSVSSATTGKKSMFTNTSINDLGDNGYQILGVKNVPVIVSEDAPQSLKDRVTFDNSVDVSTVKQYRTIDANGIGGWTLNVKDTVTDATANLETNVHWGDYLIAITENSTSHLRADRSDDHDVNSALMGVVLGTSDGTTVGLTHMDNIWIQNYEVAFSLSGNANSAELAKLEGKTVTSLTYIMPDGVYVYQFAGIYLKPQYQGETLTGTFNSDGSVFTFSDVLPAGLTNAHLTISYSAGKHQTVTLLDTDVNGDISFALDTAVPDGQTPTVTLSSDTQADITMSYSMLTWQKTSLESLAKEAKALAEEKEDANYASGYAELAAYAADAETLLQTAGASSTDAASLISALETGIEAAQVKYGTMTMTYAEFYKGLTDDTSIDAVTSATTGKKTMFANTDTADIDGGYTISGLKNVPVKVMPSASEELRSRVTWNEDASAAVSQYKTLDSNGIGGWTLNVADTVTDATAVVATSERWGDYVIKITENSTSHVRNDRSDDHDINSNLLGIVLTTTDGVSVGLTHMNNIWIQNYEMAFSRTSRAELAALEGKTIASVTYIMPSAAYVYKFSGIYIAPAYSGEALAGSFNSTGTVFTLTKALSSSLTNAKISISYKEGRTTVSLLSATAAGSDRAFKLETAVPDGVVPTVTVSSDSYADITVSFPMLTWQKNSLLNEVKVAKAALAYVDSTGELAASLQENITAAEEMAKDSSTAVADATAQITALTEYADQALASITLAVDGTDIKEKVSLADLVAEKDGSYIFDVSKLDLTNTEIFANGAEDAYLVTLGDVTTVIGDTTLSAWTGNWENWQDYVNASDEMNAKYPRLSQAWDLAYEGYIKAFEAAGMGDTIKSMYPDAAALQDYWYAMTATTSSENSTSVKSMTVVANDGTYTLTWKDNSGNVLAADSYTVTGKLRTGLEGATMYVLTADTLAEGSPFKYVVTMKPDYESTGDTPVSGHYHFQYGSSLETLLVNGQTYTGTDTNISNKTWYATMINSDSSDLAKYNVILSMHRADKWTADALEIARVTLTKTSYTVDGKKKQPGIASVTAKDGSVLPASAYTVTWPEASAAAGTYTVTVTGVNGVTGTASASWKIVKKSISTAVIKLPHYNYYYTGKSLKPAVTLKLSGKTIAASNYKVTYKNNKKVGTATVTVMAKGSTYTGSVSRTFKIVPNAVKIQSKKSLTKAFKITWKKNTTQTTGYQFQYSLKKDFSSGVKTVTVKKNTTTSYEVKNLKAGKTYYVRIRTYKILDGKVYYSGWRKATVKTK